MSSSRLTKTLSAAIQGVDALSVEIEINASGMGADINVTIVGLPDTAVRESRARVRSALSASGFSHPFGHTTINLAPANIKKEGAAFDLPIAVGMIASVSSFKDRILSNTMLVGELALDGRIRPIQGALPIAIHAQKLGIDTLIVPQKNAMESGIVQGVNVIGVKTLAETVQFLQGTISIPATNIDPTLYYQNKIGKSHYDLRDIKGQEMVKRALEVAASGGHNMLMIGPPGTGKTLIAQRLPSILPLMNLDEALETTKIHSIAGKLQNEPLLVERPFRAPHHTISDAGLIGGQSNPQPGEISLTHNGVLFLDELPEFRRSVLEVLRQPLETGDVTISRAAGSVTFPAAFQLIAAMNPCPCGHYGNLQRECRCTPPTIQRYRAKISGPLLDRIDIHVEVSPLSEEELMAEPQGEVSQTIQERVIRAKEIQRIRFKKSYIRCNAAMHPADMQKHCSLNTACRRLLKSAIKDLDLSARAYDRILRLARTISDLQNGETISEEHIAEAIQYRSLDRKLW